MVQRISKSPNQLYLVHAFVLIILSRVVQARRDAAERAEVERAAAAAAVAGENKLLRRKLGTVVGRDKKRLDADIEVARAAAGTACVRVRVRVRAGTRSAWTPTSRWPAPPQGPFVPRGSNQCDWVGRTQALMHRCVVHKP